MNIGWRGIVNVLYSAILVVIMSAWLYTGMYYLTLPSTAAVLVGVTLLTGWGMAGMLLVVGVLMGLMHEMYRLVVHDDN